MKIRLLLIGLLLATAAVHAQDIGVSLARLKANPAERVSLAKSLGAAWYRPDPVLLEQTNPSCAECEPARAAGMKLLLVIRNAARPDKASVPVSDIGALQQKLRTLLDRYKPDLLVVEDEPDDPRSFSGIAEEYGVELKSACEVSHALQIPCANGGLTSANVAAVVTDERHRSDEMDAIKFALAIEAIRVRVKQSLTIFRAPVTVGKEDTESMTRAIDKYLKEKRGDIDRARAFLAVADAAAIDHLNFHWYELQPDVLPKVADTLHVFSKRPLMTDALGQRSERPFETGEKIRVALDNFVRPVIWIGIDGSDGLVGLADKSGKLRSNATAFRREAERTNNSQ